MMRLAEPRQKRHAAKLQQLAEHLELRDFGSLVDDTLVANIALARRGGGDVLYYRAPFPEGLDEPFDVLYAAVRTTVLWLLQAQNEATGTVLSAYDHHVTSAQTTRLARWASMMSRSAWRRQFASLDHRSRSAARMDGAIDHVLLDEFQDTSPAQWQVLRPLVSRVTADDHDAADDRPTIGRSSGRSSALVIRNRRSTVGAAASAEIFDAVADQLRGCTEVEQNTSFRSSPVVIDVVNETFRNLQRHPLAAAADSGDPTDKAMYEAAAVNRFCTTVSRARCPKHQIAPAMCALTLRGESRMATAKLKRIGML